MRKSSKHRFSLKGKPLYPHIKLTKEKFPRVLATRLIERDGAEYFGAFLNRTNVRLLLDFIQRTFRLRTCEIAIDGSFNYPCTEYYKRRCVAPCVADLCSTDEYSKRVELLRYFLRNERGGLLDRISSLIETSAASLDFESAARWRDVLNAIEGFWAKTNRSVWTDDVADTIQGDARDGMIDILIVSQKGRRILGERVFSFAGEERDTDAAVGELIEQFYIFHAPKEIRVATDFNRRRDLQAALSVRFGRPVPIKLLTPSNNRRLSQSALTRSSAELDIKRMAPQLSSKEIDKELACIFRLRRQVRRISTIDVSHISGSNTVAAMVRWVDGRIDTSLSEHIATERGEIAALAELIASRLPVFEVGELLLVDGGIGHLNAALAAASERGDIAIAAAVKPSGRHSEIAQFLFGKGQQVAYDERSGAMQRLKMLRDAAHEHANALHREIRESSHFYALAGVYPSLTESERQLLVKTLGSQARASEADPAILKSILGEERGNVAVRDLGTPPRPLQAFVVSTRIQAPNGSADDLRPIDWS